MKNPQQLPVYQYRSRILQTVVHNPITIITGEPGCGKSTVIPQFLLGEYESAGKICVTQPRRLAARSLARYVARQLDVVSGSKVGFKVRFDYEVSPETALLFVTEGVLLREFHKDPLLEKYAVVVLDEVHERGVDMDLCLGLMKSLASKRRDLRIVLMSATADLERINQYFDNPPLIHVLGKSYLVSVRYVVPKGLDMVYAVVHQLHKVCAQKMNRGHDPVGHILVFLPGEGEIRAVMGDLDQKPIPHSLILPLYASMRTEDQERVFEPSPRGMRKIILATNIAETSITVPGISTVIDSGLIREADYDHATGIGSLKLVRHSRAGCDQRAGRAGRTRAGICYRLFTSQDFHMRSPFSTAEICRVSLAEVYLKMCAAGIAEPFSFPFLDAPDREAFHEAHEVLHVLGAVDDRNVLTPLGWKMVGLPIDPCLAAVLLTAAEAGCINEALTICSALSCRPLLYQPRGEIRQAREAQKVFHEEGSDCLTVLRIVREWEAAGGSERWCNDYYLRADILREIAAIREQLRNMLVQRGIDIAQEGVADRAAIDFSLMAGFGDRLWRHTVRHRYECGSGEWCVIDARSAAFDNPPQWFICSKVLYSKRPIAIGIHPVQPADLAAALTGGVQETRLPRIRYSKSIDAVTAMVLKLQEGSSTEVEAEVIKLGGGEATRFLAKALADNRLATTHTSANRVLLRELDNLRERMGEQIVPSVSQEWLRSFYEGHLAGAVSLNGAERCDLLITAKVLKHAFGYDLDTIRSRRDNEYPDSIVVCGRSIPIRYENQVPVAEITPGFVTELSYDALSLPNGDLVHLEMVLPSLGNTKERRITTTSLNELKEVLAHQQALELSQEELQRKCDALRQQLFVLRQRHTLVPATIDALRKLLDEAEEALYGWEPNLERGAKALQDLELQLQ
ncbi:MAG: helicase-related protein [Candidatus Andersenbacteria bacterium]